MEDSSSLSSSSTLSREPLVGGSADLESGFLSSSNTRTASAISFTDMNPYSLSSTPRARAIAAKNRWRMHRRLFNQVSDFDTGPHHFLDSCFLCKKLLAENRDIFMYRGDVPFCSEECRQQQMDMDEEQELAKSVARRALSRKEIQKQEPQSSQKSQKARTGSIQLAG